MRVVYFLSILLLINVCCGALTLFGKSNNDTDTSKDNNSNKTNSDSKLEIPWPKIPFKFRYDDGVIEEDIDDATNGEENVKEQGRLHLPRDIAKGVANTVTNGVSKVAGKVTDAFKSLTTSAGLDTDRSLFSGTVDKFKSKVQTIYPGTKWCGGGNKAKDNSDLGQFNDTDACCRAHDKCFDSLEAGEKKYGLENTGLFTRSHCKCDKEFYGCLKDAKSAVATSIGFTYFTVLGPQCFKEDFEATGCLEYSRGKCVRYKSDEGRGKRYQWFDSPLYI